VNSLLDPFNFYDSYHNPQKVCDIMYENENIFVCAVAKFFKVPTIKSFKWFTGVIASKRFTRVIGSRWISFK